jgi:hypothetical protein
MGELDVHRPDLCPRPVPDLLRPRASSLARRTASTLDPGSLGTTEANGQKVGAIVTGRLGDGWTAERLSQSRTNVGAGKKAVIDGR